MSLLLASCRRLSAGHVRRTASLASVRHCNRSRSSSSRHSVVALPEDIRRRVREQPLAATYDPAAVEVGWHEYWQHAIAEKKRTYTDATKDKAFTMLLPPPNVTGALHIGHALTITIQDTLARWHHMRGFDVRWIPGLDHAGIATQSVVERKLAKDEGLSRHDLGREGFLDRVWQWNEQYGGRILRQIDRLGAVVNKDDSFFTLDETRSKAVIDAFVQLYDRGLVYRRRRMVNWCPTLRTAISDIEVDSEPVAGSTLFTLPGRSKPVEFGVMHRILYKVADSDTCLEVDTTRPETIFGDVAVAVHSQDPRYFDVHGKCVVHPYSGQLLPVIVDDTLVNMELGTGVVKITPAHDPKDFECARRHNLPEPVVIDKNGQLCGDIDQHFIGMDRFEAREQVVADLKSRQLYVDKLDHPTTLSFCSRSGDVIEPMLMPQWFVDCNEMAKRAADHVRSGNLKIEPRSHEHMWYFFLDNIQDWCVSRQLWWGHRIPAYRVAGAGASEDWIVARTLDEARQRAGEKYGLAPKDVKLEQDDDVLDTWFSSGLLPISVSGWPNKDPQSSLTYPLSVMETGSDILFFWVARMAMLCEEFTGSTPFRRVLLHPMVRDKAGRKMSKSLGNVIDPMHVIEGVSLDALLQGLQSGNSSKQEMKKAERELRREFPKGIPACGTDALRYALASYLQQGRQINMDVQRVVSHRQFCNKVWNAVRFALPLLERDASNGHSGVPLADLVGSDDKLSLADRWILSRLAETVIVINESLESNQLAASVAAFNRFFVQDLCDVYIEFSKRVLYGNRVESDEFASENALRDRQFSARLTLYTCLDYSMRLLHPFAPFVSEELWQRIRTYDPHASTSTEDSSLLFATYPELAQVQSWTNDQAESQMKFTLDVLHAIRSLKHTVKTIAPTGTSEAKETIVRILSNNDEEVALLRQGLYDLEALARARVEVTSVALPSGATLTHSVSPSCSVNYEVPNDPETPNRVRTEIERLGKRVAKVTDTLSDLHARRRSEDYVHKVPEAVQQQDSVRASQLEIELQAAKASIVALQQLQQHY